jgi:hypothetical protein
MTKRTPAEAFHLSEFLQEEMDARGWDRTDVYERLGYDKTDCCAFDLLMDVHDKNMLMGEREDQALRDVFGVGDPGFFIRLYDAWRTHPSTVSESNVVKFEGSR